MLTNKSMHTIKLHYNKNTICKIQMITLQYVVLTKKMGACIRTIVASDPFDSYLTKMSSLATSLEAVRSLNSVHKS